MAAKTSKKEETFIEKITRLDGEYRMIQARIELLQAALQEKEDEINAFLYESSHPIKRT